MKERLRLGTRGSHLALAQSGQVAEALKAAWPGLEVEMVVIRTTGDRRAHEPLAALGGKGAFTREIEVALLEGQVDFGVHSLKDLPAELPAGLHLAAFPPRQDPRDCLVAAVPLAELPEGARVGTGSLRRRCQLQALRPDLGFAEIRGNLPTRVARWRQGYCQALVLAQAGLNRLGLEATGLKAGEVHPLPVEECLPAPCQGILGLECRADDTDTNRLLAALDEPATRAQAGAERAFLEELQGGCQVPAAAYARAEEGALVVDALLASLDGRTLLRCRVQGPLSQAAALGRQAGRRLLEEGGRELLDAGRGQAPPVTPP